MSFRTGPSVFKDRAKVSFDYIPEKLPHREAQVQRLFSIFRPVGDSGLAANAFLYGSVGTGKTHTAKRFCEDFRRYANEHGRGLDHVHVNCRQKMGDDAVLLHILKHFDPRFPDRGFSIPEKLDSLRKWIEKQQVHLIVILDEVDVLLKKSGSEVVYTFSRFGEEAGHGNVSLILISQRREALDHLDAAALSTFRRTNAVEFPKYSRKELVDILGIRVGLAFHPGSVDDGVVDLISDIASEYGDARYAIDLLERAGAIADEEFAGEVTPENVRAAKASVTPSDLPDRLRELEVPQKLVLLGVARKIRRKTYITTGDAEEAYAVACEEFSQKRRAHTQFWKYIQDLDALGLIDAKRSGEGVVGKTTMISLPGIPAKLLIESLEAALRRPRSRPS
ncbi:MAG: hypothetical protein A3K65_09745 [Euryarchaeota archaeon RBG_16_68_12]|nr:MAG: hypothetical protein A3K65_09745 [Euryarchaeota archaeon RBG_16_68_12]